MTVAARAYTTHPQHPYTTSSGERFHVDICQGEYSMGFHPEWGATEFFIPPRVLVHLESMMDSLCLHNMVAI